MANPKHIEWLKEGVQAWNERRTTGDFRPDLRGANLQRADLQRADLQRVNLRGVKLRGANLRWVNLRGANLQRADLRGANLRWADLRGADLQRVNLRWVNLRGANLQRADLRGADVRSVLAAPGINNGGGAAKTDLSTALDLSQAQLDSMIGDSGTLIPKHLKRPAHWEALEENTVAKDPSPSDTQPDPVSSQDDHSELGPQHPPSVIERAKLLLIEARGASMTAEMVAFHLDFELRMIRQQGANTLGPEIELLDALVATLRAVSDKVANQDEAGLAEKLAQLQEQLEAVTQELEARTKERDDLEDALDQAKQKTPSEFSKSFQTSAGNALGAAIIATPIAMIGGGVGYLLGAGANASIAAFASAALAAGIGAKK